jgi:hypothetical protein
VQGIDAGGAIVCAPIGGAARDAVNAGCAVYLGQRDSCSGCSTPPVKWGWASGDACANGVGLDSTCAPANLGGESVTLFGLSTDGDVDENDKLYLGFHCGEGSSASAPGPCDPGSFATGVSGGDVTCAAASGEVLGYVGDRCSLYLGQRDECSGCALPPTRWGRVGTTSCEAGVGSGNTCTVAPLGGMDVRLLGLQLEGDVDDNDKLYVGVRCLPPDPVTSSGDGACPPGQLVAGIKADGSLLCEGPAPAIAGYVAEHCAFTLGLRDECDGCTTAPAKWGRARDGACANGTGAGSSCADAALGDQTVSLFGLDADGNVDDNDKLYVSFRCD